MNKKLITGIVVVIIIAIVAVISISNKDKGIDQPITIGMIGILSGEYSFVGENIQNGAILAQEEYNAKNPESKITLLVEDDGYDSGKALSAYKKLTDFNNIDALINVSTPSIGAIYDLVTEVEMPVIQMGEQPTDPTADNVFQILPGNIAAEIQLGEYITEQGFTNPVVIYSQDDVMIKFKNAVLEGIGADVTELALTTSGTDYRSDVLKVSEGNHDVVVMITTPQQGAQFLRTYATQIGSLPKLAFDANVQTGFADYKRILGDTNILNDSIVAVTSQQVSDEFKVAYEARFGSAPGVMADLGYDAFNMLIDTYSKDGKGWVENVQAGGFTGVTGPITFDSVGIRNPEVTIGTIQNGELPK